MKYEQRALRTIRSNGTKEQIAQQCISYQSTWTCLCFGSPNMCNYSAAVLPSLLPVLQLVSNGQRRRPNDYDSSSNSQIQIYYETGCSVVIRAAKLKFVAENKTRVYFAQKCLNLQHCVLLRDKLVTKVVIRAIAMQQCCETS